MVGPIRATKLDPSRATFKRLELHRGDLSKKTEGIQERRRRGSAGALLQQDGEVSGHGDRLAESGADPDRDVVGGVVISRG